MTACIALAWTSPEIVVIDLDRDKYRPFIARDQKCRKELELFLQAQDNRDVVVLVEGVHTLARLSDLNVKAFVVFDTITALRGIQGALMLDQDPNQEDPAPQRFGMDDLHAVIANHNVGFSVSKDAVRVSATLSSKITLRELFEKVKRRGGSSITDEFIHKTCERVTGRITKLSWIARVRKPALASGMDVQLIAEVERFCDDSSVSEGLWRGFYDLIETNTPREDVETRYDVRGTDLDYLVEILGSTPVGPDAYASSPAKMKRKK